MAVSLSGVSVSPINVRTPVAEEELFACGAGDVRVEKKDGLFIFHGPHADVTVSDSGADLAIVKNLKLALGGRVEEMTSDSAVRQFVTVSLEQLFTPHRPVIILQGPSASPAADATPPDWKANLRTLDRAVTHDNPEAIQVLRRSNLLDQILDHISEQALLTTVCKSVEHNSVNCLKLLVASRSFSKLPLEEIDNLISFACLKYNKEAELILRNRPNTCCILI